MHKRLDNISDEWQQDPEEQIGLTNYKFKDLPLWAKKSWIKQKQNKFKS